ncbi:hypothetical protein KFU94_30890 [Chloroflexi bacterium TSY]|nr:hypothetical protein [Chloroflexi bacterium TSY]
MKIHKFLLMLFLNFCLVSAASLVLAQGDPNTVYLPLISNDTSDQAETITPQVTASHTPTHMPTFTPTVSPTPTPINTSTSTSTNIPTSCPTDSSPQPGGCATIAPTFTNTPTLTETPTPTGTSTPTSTNTPTPTDTPTPVCPQSGTWAGVTSKNLPISFTVTDSPNCQVANIRYGYQVTCSGSGGGSVTQTGTVVISEAPILDNHFDVTTTFSGNWHNLTGSFPSTSTVTGTWRSTVAIPFAGSCSNSGTWTADRNTALPPTDTPTSTPTLTDTPTVTDMPADTPTDTPTSTHTPKTPTSIPTPTLTDTPTVTDTPTNTPTFTSTPTNTPTNTSTPTITDTPTNTPTPIPTVVVCLPRSGDWAGEESGGPYPISFTVTSECMVHNLEIEFPTVSPINTCIITVTVDLPIVDNKFTFNTPGLNGIEISGEFQSASQATGIYQPQALFLCQGLPIPSGGTWSATKM